MPRRLRILFFVIGFLLSGVEFTLAEETKDVANNELPQLTIPLQGTDEDLLYHAFHGARILAESGVGYEAAQVLAALATQAEDRGPGHKAADLLRELGIAVADVREENRKAINAKIAKRVNHSRDEQQGERRDVRSLHVRNLVELDRFEQAARFMLNSKKADSADAIEEYWGDTLRRYRIPADWLTAASPTTMEKIATALQQAGDQNDLRYEVPTLWAVDHEAAELGRWLLDYSHDQRNGHDEEGERHHEEHDNAYARWVESRREREEMERRERDDDSDEEGEENRQDELEHVSAAALGRAHRIAKKHPSAARLLGKLIVAANPDSLEADSATAMIKRLKAPPSKAARRPTHEPFADKDPGHTLFAKPRVRSYQLTLSDDAIARLHENPKEYVRATFREGETVYENVGVRLKGGWGSFRMIDGRHKAAFTVKFNQFESEQRFHGLRRIILNNGAQDPSYLHEYVGYQLFRSAGIPAPRIAYANLTVNDESYGLYIQVEAVTKDFLGRWFPKTNGNLYEGPGDVLNWRELDIDANQEKADRSDLQRLAEAIERADDDDPWATLAEHVDIDAFARFVAMEQLVGHWDGYTQTNNYRIYRNTATNKFHFFPHGCDQIFEDVEQNVFRGQGGILGRALLQTETGKKKYRQALQSILDDVWREDDIRQHIASGYTMIREHVLANRGKSEHDAAEFEHHTRRMLRFVALRRLAVEAQLRRGESKNDWRERRDEEHHLPSIFHHDENDW